MGEEGLGSSVNDLYKTQSSQQGSWPPSVQVDKAHLQKSANSLDLTKTTLVDPPLGSQPCQLECCLYTTSQAWVCLEPDSSISR